MVDRQVTRFSDGSAVDGGNVAPRVLRYPDRAKEFQVIAHRHLGSIRATRSRILLRYGRNTVSIVREVERREARTRHTRVSGVELSALAGAFERSIMQRLVHPSEQLGYRGQIAALHDTLTRGGMMYWVVFQPLRGTHRYLTSAVAQRDEPWPV